MALVCTLEHVKPVVAALRDLDWLKMGKNTCISATNSNGTAQEIAIFVTPVASSIISNQDQIPSNLLPILKTVQWRPSARVGDYTGEKFSRGLSDKWWNVFPRLHNIHQPPLQLKTCRDQKKKDLPFFS